jgi:hypothetical protein
MFLEPAREEAGETGASFHNLWLAFIRNSCAIDILFTIYKINSKENHIE